MVVDDVPDTFSNRSSIALGLNGDPGAKTDPTQRSKNRVSKKKPKIPVLFFPTFFLRIGKERLPNIPKTAPTAVRIPIRLSFTPWL